MSNQDNQNPESPEAEAEAVESVEVVDGNNVEVLTDAEIEAELEPTPLEAAETKAKESHDNMLRLAAEMDNLRKRTQREVEQARKFGTERFAKEMLEILDNLQRGVEASQTEGATIETVREGSEMTLKQLTAALEKFQVKEIDAEGQKFNPERHEAMAMQPSADHEPDTVMTVVQKGYELHGRVLRPARVLVAKAVEA